MRARPMHARKGRTLRRHSGSEAYARDLALGAFAVVADEGARHLVVDYGLYGGRQRLEDAAIEHTGGC